jgi:hypothetical protein
VRARAALAEARAEMPTLMRDVERPPTVEHVPAEAAGLRQALRSYTDHVDRLLAAADDERRALREQVMRLNEELLLLRAEVADLRAVLPSGQGPAPQLGESAGSPAQPAVSQAREAEMAAAAAPDVAAPALASDAASEAAIAGAETTEREAAEPGAPAEPDLESRLFPAGTIGVLVALSPVDDFRRLAMIQERLAQEAPVEHVELTSYEFGEARIRITFRQPARGPWLKEALERAAGAPIAPEAIVVDQGTVHARFGEAGIPATRPIMRG